MNVKGMAFLSKKSAVVKQFGEPAWNEFVAEQGRLDPAFTQQILPITLIPASSFLPFLDRLVARFYGGDAQVYWALGEKSADWAFKEGPNRSLFYSGDFKRFLTDTPTLWRTYFTAGKVATTIGSGVAELNVTEVPTPHAYLELAVMGHVSRGLELTGGKQVSHERVRGFVAGDPDIAYRFRWS
jgi:hypothetical protein